MVGPETVAPVNILLGTSSSRRPALIPLLRFLSRLLEAMRQDVLRIRQSPSIWQGFRRVALGGNPPGRPGNAHSKASLSLNSDDVFLLILFQQLAAFSSFFEISTSRTINHA